VWDPEPEPIVEAAATARVTIDDGVEPELAQILAAEAAELLHRSRKRSPAWRGDPGILLGPTTSCARCTRSRAAPGSQA